MTAFDGCRNHDDPGLDPERLARMAEADNWLHAPGPRRRRWARGARYAEALLGLICVAAMMLGLAAVAFGLQ